VARVALGVILRSLVVPALVLVVEMFVLLGDVQSLLEAT
jgi:hypothetical protein